MKISQLTQAESDTVRLKDLIDEAKAGIARANTLVDMVSWTDPNGNVYIDHRDKILEIIESGSWR